MEDLINLITNNPWLFGAVVLFISMLGASTFLVFNLDKKVSALISDMDDLKPIRLNAKAISEMPQQLDELIEMCHQLPAEIAKKFNEQIEDSVKTDVGSTKETSQDYKKSDPAPSQPSP